MSQSSARRSLMPIVHLVNVLLATLLIVLAGSWNTLHHTFASEWQRLVASSVTVSDPPQAVRLPKTTLAQLSPCPKGTVVVIVAHQDDDLLFMNPDIQRDISSGRCIQSIYLTTGDDGHDGTYWQSREAGSEAAYAAMFNAENQWRDSAVTVGPHQLHERVLVDHQSQVGLIFMRFPDGGLKGEGFASTHSESLSKLQRGTIKTIHTIDTNDSFSYQQILDVLRVVIATQKPDVVYAQQPAAHSEDADHSDHRLVGQLAWQAVAASGKRYEFKQFISYPIGFMPQNVIESEALQKQHIFEIYAHYDATICTGPTGDCPNENTYSNYFSRMYSITRWP